MAIEKRSTMKPDVPSWQSGMRLFLKLSGWIGVPVLIAAIVGRYLDAQYHTNPWLFLSGVGIAFIISTFALIHYGLKEMNRIESETSGKSK